MDNKSFEKQRKKDNQKLIEEGFVSEIKREKKIDYKSFFVDVITFAIAFCVIDKLIELTSIESMALRILFKIAIITIVLLIKEFIVTIFSKRKK